MGRPRKYPLAAPSKEESKEDEQPTTRGTRTVKYSGPPGQINHDFVAEVGGEPKKGKEYEVSKKLADSLIKSSRHWEEA